MPAAREFVFNAGKRERKYAQASESARTRLDRLADLFYHDLYFQKTTNSNVHRNRKHFDR